MPNTPNGKYGNRAWDKPVGVPVEAAYPPQAYIGPFASNQERLLTQAMEVGNMTSAEVQEYVRPNLPQVVPFRSRYGYEKAAYTIDEIINNGGASVTERIDVTKTPGVSESTSRNTLGTV